MRRSLWRRLLWLYRGFAESIWTLVYADFGSSEVESYVLVLAGLIVNIHRILRLCLSSAAASLPGDVGNLRRIGEHGVSDKLSPAKSSWQLSSWFEAVLS